MKRVEYLRKAAAVGFLAARKWHPNQGKIGILDWVVLRSYRGGRREFEGFEPLLATFEYVCLNEIALRNSIFTGTVFKKTDLFKANFSGSNFINSIFLGCDLCGANLNTATLSGCAIHASRMNEAVLCGAVFNEGHILDTSMEKANAVGAKLSMMTVAGADASGSHFNDALISQCSLQRINLTDASMEGASISNSLLLGVQFCRTKLAGCSFRGVKLADVRIVDTDITALCDAESSIDHTGPSMVDFLSIVKSIRSPNLGRFLRKTGMPEVFVEYSIDCARSLDPGIIFSLFQSTFISYGGPDEPFARKLYEALLRNGVTAFLFSEHGVPGEKLHQMMHKGVNEHDRVILVCSKASLLSKGVLNEIEETLAREARDGGVSYLIPIRLDGYVFEAELEVVKPFVARALRDRVVADFEGTDKDDAKFCEVLQRLLSALKKK